MPINTFADWKRAFHPDKSCSVYVDPNEEDPQPVVVKLMKDEAQYRREVEQRKVLSNTHCVGTLFCSGDEPDKWADGVAEREYPEYKLGIVMPAAERNLLTVLVQERVTFDGSRGVRSTLFKIAECLQHMHSKGKVHGDIKPLNVVRTYDDEFKLIDFDATVDKGSPIGAKTSTAYIPPELVAAGATGLPVVKSEANFINRSSGVDRRGSLGDRLLAHPTFDVWSYGVVAFRSLTRELLFKSDDSDNCTGNELTRVMNWDLQALEREVCNRITSQLQEGTIRMRSGKIVSDKEIFQTAHLMTWMLQPVPKDRPQSFEQILSHPFFEAQISPQMQKLPMYSHATLQMPAFLAAAALGEHEKVQQIIESAKDDFEIDKVEPLLGKSAVHLAAEAGHATVVKCLMDAGANVQMLDLNNNSALLSVLALLEEAKDQPNENYLATLDVLFNSYDVDNELRNSAGQSAVDLSKASKWPGVRLVAAKLVISLLGNKQPFDPDLFQKCWETPELRHDLEAKLESTFIALTTLPDGLTDGDVDYLKTYIFPLDIWDRPDLFKGLLQRLAETQESAVLRKTHEVRDGMVAHCEAGQQVGSLESIAGASVQAFDATIVAALGEQMGTVKHQDACESDVFVPYLHLLSEKAMDYFQAELKHVFPDAVFTSDPSAEADQAISVAPPKGEPRMQHKVLEYRAEVLLEQCIEQGIEVDTELETDPDALRDLLKKRRGLAGGEDTAAEEWTPISIAKVRDSLRCTVDCKNGRSVWKTFQEMQAGFDLREGNGRLKNNMKPENNNMGMGAAAKPPDMLANVILKPNKEFGITYPMVVEVQIHLREINHLKHQNHILYKIKRAESAAQLRASAPPTSHPAVEVPDVSFGFLHTTADDDLDGFC